MSPDFLNRKKPGISYFARKQQKSKILNEFFVEKICWAYDYFAQGLLYYFLL